MGNSLENQLGIEMNNSIYLLTTLIHREIEETTNGCVGYQITQGIWYKLKVFLMISTKGVIQYTVVHEEQFWTESGAFKKLDEIKKKKQYNFE